QWTLLRARHDLIPNAVDEALRLEAPVRAFTRVAAHDHRIQDATIGAGDRILIIYGSGNRDERRYDEPDHFDITRDAKDHLGFGHGVHRCAGAYLAELEMEALLRAMVGRVTHIEVGEP